MNNKLPPSLAELTARSLADRGTFTEDFGDVEPHETLSGIRVDARAGWADAQVALKLLGVDQAPVAMPADWASFANWNPGRIDIPLCMGQFPQRLRDASALFSDLSVFPAAKPHFAGLEAWIASRPECPVAGGLAREFGVTRPTSLRGSSAKNEGGADLWFRGSRSEARKLWEALPVGPVRSFNLGLADLFLGHRTEAVVHLRDAVRLLPESSAWNHLASLYLAVAQS